MPKGLITSFEVVMLSNAHMLPRLSPPSAHPIRARASLALLRDAEGYMAEAQVDTRPVGSSLKIA